MFEIAGTVYFKHVGETVERVEIVAARAGDYAMGIAIESIVTGEVARANR